MSLALIPRAHYPRTRSRYMGRPTNFLSAREADRLFSDFFGALAPSPCGVAQHPRGFVPKLGVTESDEAYTISAELPGVKQEDLEIVIEDGVLTLKGEKKNERESEQDGVRSSEMQYGSFERRVAFRGPIAEDEVKARYVDGLVTITVPKPPEARPQVRTVPVETA